MLERNSGGSRSGLAMEDPMFGILEIALTCTHPRLKGLAMQVSNAVRAIADRTTATRRANRPWRLLECGKEA